MYVWLTHSDGQYCTRPVSGERAANDLRAKGHTVVHVRDGVWQAWEAHLRQDQVFQALWQALDEAEQEKR